MLTIDPEQTVGDFVRQKPARARVFESLKIDYCCGGKVSLSRACEKRGIAVDEVLAKIEQSDQATEQTQLVDVDAMTLTQLADHIEVTHHAYLREELPRLDFMTEKVSRVHGDKDARLFKMREAFVALKAELEPHMMKEERILFPIVRQLEASSGRPEFHCGSVANPIRQMEHEHDQAGDALAMLNESTDGYTPPEWACNTYRAMLDSLAKLEADMHQHIHKENNVLFPKAIQFEQAT
ncbi:iron-sulfur cluster repair di-iron protein [Aporhodopirellula aestuarii]|uniref:Iron-sulfur cluster repair di-iron protein n=1 Tax=Aporhodopirellula aestuarii TaxID=2950107 RepID=A0ABT0TY25_9BACT|nr:iron-sulfur cluster repair di-iron protein [Aporhodopirellula aestuarii]MCM2369484.1 iron-sulfur cluster repair di-iron protein [Aporhodopirellula aestuarii]